MPLRSSWTLPAQMHPQSIRKLNITKAVLLIYLTVRNASCDTSCTYWSSVVGGCKKVIGDIVTKNSDLSN